VDGWLNAAGIRGDKKGALFRAIHKGDELTENPMTRIDVFRMIKRRAKAGRPALLHLLSHISCDRYHNVHAEWRHA